MTLTFDNRHLNRLRLITHAGYLNNLFAFRQIRNVIMPAFISRCAKFRPFHHHIDERQMLAGKFINNVTENVSVGILRHRSKTNNQQYK